MSDYLFTRIEFRARARELFRHIEATAESIVVTDHGESVLEIRPCRDGMKRDPLDVLRGSVLRFDHPLSPVGADAWGGTVIA